MKPEEENGTSPTWSIQRLETSIDSGEVLTVGPIWGGSRGRPIAWMERRGELIDDIMATLESHFENILRAGTAYLASLDSRELCGFGRAYSEGRSSARGRTTRTGSVEPSRGRQLIRRPAVATFRFSLSFSLSFLLDLPC